MKYTVEYSKKDADGNFVHWHKWKNIQQQEFNISGLERGAEYEFRVTAVNVAGQSDEQAVKRFHVLTHAVIPPRPGEGRHYVRDTHTHTHTHTWISNDW